MLEHAILSTDLALYFKYACFYGYATLFENEIKKEITQALKTKRDILDENPKISNDC
jgi:hypothetical protein